MGLALRRALYVAAISFVLSVSVFGGSAESERPLVRQVKPVYPAIAQNLRLTGSVRLQVRIASDGTVKKVEVLGGHPVLGQAAMDAVKQWKYQAGSEETRTVVLNFNL